MEELSIEQKAKRYDEAIKRAKELLEVGLKDTRDKRVVLSFLPELAESEGENICKNLIAFLKQCKAVYGDCFKQFGLEIDDAIDWLEKHDEQKHTAEEVLIKAGLKPYKDGDQWCVLLGDNIQEGICGFGNTIEDALYAFLKDLIAKKSEQKLDGTFVNVDDVREDFVNEVYRVLDADPNNDRANQIIDAFDNLPTVAIEKQGEQETLCDKCKKAQPSHSCQDITELGRCAVEHEQKSADKIEPRFKVGDWIVRELDNTCYQIKKHILNVTTNKYGYDLTNGGYISSQDANFYHLWTIQDAKDGDVLNSVRVKATIIFKGFNPDGKHINAYCALQKGILIRKEMLWDRDFEPATKGQRDTLMKAMTDAGYTFDFEKKELKKIEQKPADIDNKFIRMRETKPKDISEFLDRLTTVEQEFLWEHIAKIRELDKEEQKPVKVPKFKAGDFIQFNGIGHTRYTVKEVCGLSHYINTCDKRMDMSYTDANFELVEHSAWSEEDEEHLNSIISDIKADMGAYPRSQEVIDIYNDEISFLKSLKDRYTWKPSDEQLDSLYDVLNPCDGFNREVLESLYQDLKKLREE